MEQNNVISEAMINNFHLTSEDLAEELGMELSYFRVWKNKMEKAEKLVRPAVGSLLCIPDPQMGNRLLYSEAYLEKLKEVRGTNKIHKRKSAIENSLKNAVMKITVPLFDQNIVNIILTKFKDEEGIQTHLRDHLKDLAIPALNKLEEIKKRHEKEMLEIMAEL